jgi:hypothetical protein
MGIWKLMDDVLGKMFVVWIAENNGVTCII